MKTKLDELVDALAEQCVDIEYTSADCGCGGYDCFLGEHSIAVLDRAKAKEMIEAFLNEQKTV